MKPLPQKIYTASQVRALDRIAIEEFSIPGFSLMQRAGEAAFQFMRREWPQKAKLALLCGTGNNGGDGFIVAGLAKQAGLSAEVFLIGEPEQIKGDAAQAWQWMLSQGVETMAYSGQHFQEYEIIIDALLGTGAKGELEGLWQDAVVAINAAALPVLALDIPTGVNADTGSITNVSVKADATITFVGMKQGLVTGEGAACAGKLSFCDLDIPDDVYGRVECSLQQFDWGFHQGFLGPRDIAAHKGNYGHLLLIGGNSGMSGAMQLAGAAALRTGAGLVSLATHPSHAAYLNLQRPELMCYAVEQERELLPMLKRTSVVAIGPGLGQDAWAMELFNTVLQSDLPLVVDADALNLLAAEPVDRGNWVLTPHPGEAARLLNTCVAEVQADRFSAIKALSARYNATVVLKGNGSLVYDGESMSVCMAGNPGMATGGMGDLLTGTIAALIAQHIPLDMAARIGVQLHAMAADKAAVNGERGLLASDLLPHLRKLANPSL